MKNIIITILVVGGLATAAGWTLASNKRKIEEQNQAVDRSHVPVAVAVETVSQSDFSGEMSFPGVIETETDADISVSSPGKIKTLTIQKGSRVGQGQVVGTVDTEQLKLRLKALKLTEQKLQEDVARVASLVQGNAAPEVNLKDLQYNLSSTQIQIEQLEQQIADNNIISPISGVVTVKNMEAGEFANPGMVIAKVVNIATLKLPIFVNEKHVYKLAATQTVTLVTDVMPGKVFKGRISYISPVGDENHNYRVEVTLDGEATQTLKAGTYAIANLGTTDAGKLLTVSDRALVSGLKEPTVYVVEGDHVKLRKVITGRQEGERVEVIGGLKEGEKVVTAGQINLTDGSLVEISAQ